MYIYIYILPAFRGPQKFVDGKECFGPEVADFKQRLEACS